MTTSVAVAMRGIHKRFGPVRANDGVDLTIAAGTVHGIVGENGAGKSTLMSILYGFYQADAGEIAVDGRPVRITGSREAIAQGIGMVHQHFMLVDTLSALDNVMLGAEPDWRLSRARATVRAKLEAWASTLPPQLAGRDEAAVRATLVDQVELLLRDLADRMQRHANEGADSL